MGEYAQALAYLVEYCQNEDQVRLAIQKGCAHFRREGPGDLEIAEIYFVDALKILDSVDSKPERTNDRVRVLINLGWFIRSDRKVR